MKTDINKTLTGLIKHRRKRIKNRLFLKISDEIYLFGIEEYRKKFLKIASEPDWDPNEEELIELEILKEYNIIDL